MGLLTIGLGPPDDNWSAQARCRTTVVEMVPGTIEDEGTAADIIAAKRVCEFCAVDDECLASAQATEGRVRGVWGGLTRPERERLRLNGEARAKRYCASCRLPCVPKALDEDRCDACFYKESKQRPRPVDDYRHEIIALVDAGLSYKQVSLRLGLSLKSVSEACRKWGKTSVTSGRRGKARTEKELESV